MIPGLLRGQSSKDSGCVSICSEHKEHKVNTEPSAPLCPRELPENNVGHLSWGQAFRGALTLMTCQKEQEDLSGRDSSGALDRSGGPRYGSQGPQNLAPVWKLCH